MTLRPTVYLSFDGCCEAALRFYEARLGATIGSTFTFAGSPMAGDVPPGWQAKIMHASLTIGGIVISAADAPPGQYARPTGFQILLETDDVAEAERAFAALAEDGEIRMPLQETFWAARFGMVTDQFGIPWSINGGQ